MNLGNSSPITATVLDRRFSTEKDDMLSLKLLALTTLHLRRHQPQWLLQTSSSSDRGRIVAPGDFLL